MTLYDISKNERKEQYQDVSLQLVFSTTDSLQVTLKQSEKYNVCHRTDAFGRRERSTMYSRHKNMSANPRL